LRHRPTRRGRRSPQRIARCQPHPPPRHGVGTRRGGRLACASRMTSLDAPRFEPIAIVGRGCVLPGARSPEQFWDNIASGRVSLEAVRPEDWRLPPTGLGAGPGPGPGRTATAGLVRGFAEVFDPGGFATDAEQVAAYDPALQWVLYAGRAALSEAGDHV